MYVFTVTMTITITSQKNNFNSMLSPDRTIFIYLFIYTYYIIYLFAQENDTKRWTQC